MFPRPEIGVDKSAEDWSEFTAMWEQYKEEYEHGSSIELEQVSDTVAT